MNRAFKRILVPVDFSHPSLQALEYAVELARPLKAELFLCTWSRSFTIRSQETCTGPATTWARVYQELERSGREQLARCAAKLQKRHLTVRTLLTVGTAPHVIVETAKKWNSDLIVMSTHGRTGLSHVLMGRVAERVVRTAACPVLTIRARVPGARTAPPRPDRKHRRSKQAAR